MSLVAVYSYVVITLGSLITHISDTSRGRDASCICSTCTILTVVAA